MKLIEQFVRHILTEEVRQHLDINVPDELLKISNIFQSSGYQLFLVGGAVRDALMGKQPKDWDIATNAEPDQVLAMMRKHREYKLLEIGKSFGVVVIVTPSGEEIEVATFRKDIGSGRRPDSVEFTSLDKDVLRRDLTINALAWSFQTHEVIDYVGGIEDIKNNVVRTVGNPEDRFAEDRLRILRAFRFAGRLGAKLDLGVVNALMRDNSLTGVSPERIRDEFLKGIASAKSVTRYLTMLDESGLFPQILPGLKVDLSITQTRNVPVQLALLLRDNDPAMLAKRLNALKYSADEVAQVTFLVQFTKNTVASPILRNKKAYAQSKLTDSDLLEFTKLLGPAMLSHAQKFLEFQPTVTAAQLMAQGFSGKELGDEMAKREQKLWLNMHW